MFSGIVEAQSKILKTSQELNGEFANSNTIRIFIFRPVHFNDLKKGDSICVNGVCLTIEEFNSEHIQFCIGSETISILGNSFSQWVNKKINLERSLKFGDRIHGHLVTGHVDCIGQVVKSFQDGECWQMVIEVPIVAQKFLWKKGSVCLNGVSLTINKYENNLISVCLIPETILATNLTSIAEGEFVNIETDYLAKAYFEKKSEMKV